MPLEKLREYQGINPCPNDFDSFWDSSVAELDKVDFDVEFKPYPLTSSHSDAYELTFTSVGGARIYAKFLRPKKIDEKAPAILFFHGLSGASPEWTTLLTYAAEGFVVAALDTRGQGGYSQDVGVTAGTTFTTPFIRGIDGDPKDMLVRNEYLDTAALARIVMGLDYVDEKRIAATGGSQGGALTLACCSLVPEVKLCAPIFPYLCDYKRVWEMDLDKGAYEGIRYYLRHFDPRHERIDEFFTKLGYIDLQFLAPRIRAKVLMSTGLMDTICPPSTQFAAYNKIKSEKQIEIYPDYGHESIKGVSDRIFEFIVKNI